MRSDAKSASSSRWSTERSALAVETLRRTGHLQLRAHGESMLPALWPGDVVEIKSCTLQDLHPGHIVLALRDGRFFLHRLVEPGSEQGFVLCGDSMPGSDPFFPSEALLGRLVSNEGSERAFSKAALCPGFGAKLSRALGIFLCHCNIARRLALKLHSWRSASASEFASTEPASGAIPSELLS
jgi:hypothetical protein